MQQTVISNAAQSAQDWLALSGAGLLDSSANPFQTLHKASFIAELRLPLPRSAVLINHQSHEGQHRSFALFYDDMQGFSLLMRAGEKVLRASLRLTTDLQGNTARLRFNFDSQSGTWELEVACLQNDQPSQCGTGIGSLPLGLRDVQQLCLGGAASTHVLWFGVSRGAQLPKSAPWIGQRTLIETPLGPVPAGHLKAGDRVLTQDHGTLVLQNVQHVHLPARGSFAPILLRGPFYDPRGDVLVSADQPVLLAGAEVDYLFGVEQVLVQAKDLVDGRTALAEDRRSIISAIRLDLGCPALVGAPKHGKGVLLAIGDSHYQPKPQNLPLITSYEAATLLRMMGRIVSKSA